MKAAEFVKELRAKGVEVELGDADAIMLAAKREVLTESDLGLLRRDKAQIIALLRAEAVRPQQRRCCRICGQPATLPDYGEARHNLSPAAKGVAVDLSMGVPAWWGEMSRWQYLRDLYPPRYCRACWLDHWADELSEDEIVRDAPIYVDPNASHARVPVRAEAA